MKQLTGRCHSEQPLDGWISEELGGAKEMEQLTQVSFDLAL